jgi:hypothetical protein
MKRLSLIAIALALGCQSRAQVIPLTRADGLQLAASGATLLITLPGQTQPAIEVLFPEHVTALQQGRKEAEHLYLSRPDVAPAWRRSADSLQYERDLPHDIHMLARATLEDDGVLFHYEITNHSAVAYSMIYAVTDPRLHGELRDVRLERTYVHHPEGFDLLASERPVRLPCRFLASYRWPVPARLVERGEGGVTNYTKSRKVDEPFIATLSADRTWVVASFARDAGNVWSNPELTCQHVDPQAPLAPHGRVTLEVKMLVMRGSLEQALQKERLQRASLRNR